MPHQKYQTNNEPDFSLVAEEDHFETSQEHFTIHRPGLYPSEASVEYMDGDRKIVLGKCMRAVWYRALNIPRTEGISPGLMMKAHLGKWDEIGTIKKWKEMGIWVANNIKFYNKDLALSGELDAIIKNPITGKLMGTECFSPDTLVVLQDYKTIPIKDLKTIDSPVVLSHRGQGDPVVNVQVKNVKDETLYRLKGKFDGLVCEHTEEHPIEIATIKTQRLTENSKTRSYSVDSTKWVNTKDVQRGDYVCIPKVKFSLDQTSLRYDVLGETINWRYRTINNKIYSWSNNALQQETGFPTEIYDLKSFYWLLGLYIAEGSCSKNIVYFSLHVKETKIVDRIRDIAKNLFGLDITVTRLKCYCANSLGQRKIGELTNGINVSISSRPLRELIKDIIPGNSKDRTKHVKYDRIHKDYLGDILSGIWEGDGHKSRVDQFKISTVVPHLAYFYFQLAAYQGLSPAISKYKQGNTKVKSDYIYIVSWSENTTKCNQEKLIDGQTFWCYKVKKIDTRLYTGEVYNLESKDSNTYTAGMIAVHNCKTFYGYPANRSICGIKREKGSGRFLAGRPKDDHFLQTLLYFWEYQNRLDEFRIYYLERGDGHRIEFRVGFQENPDGTHQCYWEQVPGQYWNAFKEGKVLQPYTVEDVHHRYKKALEFLQKRELPPKDYSKEWDAETVEFQYQQGNVSKTNYDKWVKNPRAKTNKLGNWQCQWCQWEDQCTQDSLTSQA